MKLCYKLINKKKMIHLSRQMIMKILLKRMIMYLRQSKKLIKLSNSKSSKVKIRMHNRCLREKLMTKLINKLFKLI